ncbi:MAG: YHYH protein [Chitinophagaceae bacterium]
MNLTASGHHLGHYQENDEQVMNQWDLKTGEIIRGNFSFYKNDIIYLEQAHGQLISIPINQFSNQDQLLLNAKIRKIKEINRSPSIPNTPTWVNRLPSIPTLTILALFFILLISLLPSKILYLPSLGNIGIKSIGYAAIVIIYISACSKKETSSNSPIVVTTIPKTRLTFLDSSFQLFKPVISTTSDNTYYLVSSNGFPSHGMMIGITSWQQQVPIPQSYSGTNSWSIPLQPVYAAVPLSTKTNLMKGAVAIAINGIPIFNALNNRGEDSYAIGELDNWGGHCGRADDYHYHAAPMHLNETITKLPIAFALDGFAVYGSKEPNGNIMNALDTCHGHLGEEGVYHYHGTSSYPYVVGAMKGKVSLDPSTSAPENQILPQAFAKAVRPATNPLKGAMITDFKSTGTNAYSLTYKIGTKFGYVNYNWDANNKYTYTLIDTAGVPSTTVYQR